MPMMTWINQVFQAGFRRGLAEHSSPTPSPHRQERIAAGSLAQLFHETYERLAPEFSYKTRKASAVPWDAVPDNNKRLMVAVAGEVLAALDEPEPPLGTTDTYVQGGPWDQSVPPAEPAECPICGYTEEDKLLHGDHRLCPKDPHYRAIETPAEQRPSKG